MSQCRYPVTVMRGGTSRGLFFHESALPEDEELRDRVLLRAIGSPDPYGRQIDGLGGATSSTSKIVIVHPSQRVGIDVEYTFGQVRISEPVIDYTGNCGNLSAAVGPFAVDELVVTPPGSPATLRMFNRNTRKQIDAEFELESGSAAVAGDYHIDGVPGTGARIALTYHDPAGSLTGKLLPSGSARDEIEVNGLGKLNVSIVDAASPVTFIRASDLGLSGTESPDDINTRIQMLKACEDIRVATASYLGYRDLAPGAFRVAMVSPPQNYVATNGAHVDNTNISLCSRIISLGRAHHVHTLTGAICLAVASQIPETVPAELSRDGTGDSSSTVRIGHAAGVVDVGVTLDLSDPEPHVESVTTYRTARRLMDGHVHVPAELNREFV